MSCNRPQTVTLTVPFAARLEVNAEYMAFIDHPLVSVCVYAEASKAKGKLKTQLIAQIEDGLRALKYTETLLLGCGDGTVLVVCYNHGAWGYHIGGPGHKYAGSSAGAKDYSEATVQARSHAEQSYGGVLWESIL